MTLDLQSSNNNWWSATRFNHGLKYTDDSDEWATLTNISRHLYIPTDFSLHGGTLSHPNGPNIVTQQTTGGTPRTSTINMSLERLVQWFIKANDEIIVFVIIPAGFNCGAGSDQTSSKSGRRMGNAFVPRDVAFVPTWTNINRLHWFCMFDHFWTLDNNGKWVNPWLFKGSSTLIDPPMTLTILPHQLPPIKTLNIELSRLFMVVVNTGENQRPIKPPTIAVV